MAQDDVDETEDRPRRRRRKRQEYDDYDDDVDEDDRRRSRRSNSSELNPAGLIVPLDVHPLAVVALFSGLLSCFPLAGVIFGIAAIICGILALRSRKRKSGYGSTTGNIRAIVGLILGVCSLLIHTAALVIWAFSKR